MIYIYIYSLNILETWLSHTKDLNIGLDALMPSIQHYKVKNKGKLNNKGK